MLCPALLAFGPHRFLGTNVDRICIRIGAASGVIERSAAEKRQEAQGAMPVASVPSNVSTKTSATSRGDSRGNVKERQALGQVTR